MNRLVVLTISLFLLTTYAAEAGWMDKITTKVKSKINQEINEAKYKTEKAVDKKIDESIDSAVNFPENAAKNVDWDKNAGHSSINETNFPEYVMATDMNRASEEKIINSKLVDLYGGNTTPWNIAPEDSLKVLETEIKEIRLGTPLIVAKDILQKQGFEWVAAHDQFEKELVDTNSGVKEMTPSERFKIPQGQKNDVLKRYYITVRYVPSDDTLIKELSEDKELKKRIKQAQKLQKSAGQDGPLNLIYSIEYRQNFVKGTKFDQESLITQLKGIFGEPNYTWNQGSAFGTGKNWLIYHDGAHIPVEEKLALLSEAPKKERHAFKSAFIHPCGGKDTKNCPAAPVTSAFPDDIDKQLAALKIAYSPVMMVEFRSPNIKTYMSWEYLHSHKSTRDYYAKNEAYDAQPVATLDF